MKSDKITVRIENDTRFVKIFGSAHSKAHVFHEALNLVRIEQTVLNVPSLIEVAKIDGCWAIATDYIKGKSLSDLMKENPEKKEEYLEILAALQVQVHSITEPLLEELKDRLHHKIRTCGLCATERFALHTRLRELPESKTVCHGDLSPSNVIITEDGTPYLVDWARAAHGDSAADAAGTYLFFLTESDEETAEKYLALYCQKSETDREKILRWIPIIAASRLGKSSGRTYEILLEKAKLYK